MQTNSQRRLRQSSRVGLRMFSWASRFSQAGSKVKIMSSTLTVGTSSVSIQRSALTQCPAQLVMELWRTVWVILPLFHQPRSVREIHNGCAGIEPWHFTGLIHGDISTRHTHTNKPHTNGHETPLVHLLQDHGGGWRFIYYWSVQSKACSQLWITNRLEKAVTPLTPQWQNSHFLQACRTSRIQTVCLLRRGKSINLSQNRNILIW